MRASLYDIRSTFSAVVVRFGFRLATGFLDSNQPVQNYTAESTGSKYRCTPLSPCKIHQLWRAFDGDREERDVTSGACDLLAYIRIDKVYARRKER